MQKNSRLSKLISQNVIEKTERFASKVMNTAVVITDESGNFSGKVGVPEYAAKCLAAPSGLEEFLKSARSGSAECLGGLFVISPAITVGGERIGFLSCGWAFIGEPNEAKIAAEAKKAGFEKDYLCCLADGVKRIDGMKAERIAEVAVELADLVSSLLQSESGGSTLGTAAPNQSVAKTETRLLAGLSHELKAPINSVLDLTESALHEEISQYARDNINNIHSSAGRLLSIVNSTLDYSRTMSGEMPIVDVEYDTAALIDDALAAVRGKISGNVELTVDLPTSFPERLCGDNVRILQILTNLLDNAAKFTQSGHIELKLAAAPFGEDSVTVRAEISDTGCGIKAENAKRAFEPFWKGDSSRGGLGLGLPTAQQLCRLMGGSLAIKQRREQQDVPGSTFVFELPQRTAGKSFAESVKQKTELAVYLDICSEFTKRQIARDLAAAGLSAVDSGGDFSRCGRNGCLIISRELLSGNVRDAVRANTGLNVIVLVRHDSTETFSEPNITPFRIPSYSIRLLAAMGLFVEHGRSDSGAERKIPFTAPKAKVLVVDDNEINRTVAESVMKPLGMKVDTAGSAVECLEKVRSTNYDVVLMDHMMPDTDGIETKTLIRKELPSYADVPIIALSANDNGGARDMFLEQGMDDFIAKPIEVNELAGKLRKWLPEEKIVPAPRESIIPAAKKRSYFPQVNGLDTDAALALLGGDAELLMSVMKQFYRSIDSKEKRIRTLWISGNTKDFTTEVHSLKSTAKQIGANHISSSAAILEQAGIRGDIDFISRHTNALLTEYLRLKQDMAKLFPDDSQTVSGDYAPTAAYGSAAPTPKKKPVNSIDEQEEKLLDEMTEALEEMDTIRIDDVLDEFGEIGIQDDEKTFYERLKHAADDFDIDEAQEVVSEWRDKIHK